MGQMPHVLGYRGLRSPRDDVALVQGAWHGSWCSVAGAIDHLGPQAAYPWTVACSLTEPHSVRCTYVVCTEDQMVNTDWSRRFARDIGADIVELPGSHSPLLSRPSAVADVLLRVAG